MIFLNKDKYLTIKVKIHDKFELLPKNTQLYVNLGPNIDERVAVIFPTFTAAAYTKSMLSRKSIKFVFASIFIVSAEKLVYTSSFYQLLDYPEFHEVNKLKTLM